MRRWQPDLTTFATWNAFNHDTEERCGVAWTPSAPRSKSTDARRMLGIGTLDPQVSILTRRTGGSSRPAQSRVAAADMAGMLGRALGVPWLSTRM